jgi:hypothetical protein
VVFFHFPFVLWYFVTSHLFCGILSLPICFVVFCHFPFVLWYFVTSHLFCGISSLPICSVVFCHFPFVLWYFVTSHLICGIFHFPFVLPVLCHFVTTYLFLLHFVTCFVVYYRLCIALPIIISTMMFRIFEETTLASRQL